MGVTGFYKHIFRKYPKCILHDNEQFAGSDLFFDFNSLIHPVIHKVLDSCENDEIPYDDLIYNFITDIIKYTDDIIKYVKPKFVFIAIDGVPPRAKMIQQRLRRYKSERNNLFDTNAISPGTDFMNTLDIYMKKYLKNDLPMFVKKHIYSGSNQPGEGEHNIIQYIRNKYKKKPRKKILIYGLDADLIMLTMNLHIENIFLVREIQHFEPNYVQESDDYDLNMNFLSIETLKDSLIQNTEELYKIRFKCEVSFVSDFIFLCFLLGNDFLPHLKAIDIYNNGINVLLKIYCNILKKTKQNYNEYIVINKNNKYELNIIFLKQLFNNICKEEENLIYHNISNNKKKRIHLDDYPIKYNNKNWKNRYYDYFYRTYDPIYINNICENYFKTLIWNMKYYFDKCPCWKHYYKYKGVLVQDLYNYIKFNNINNITFEENKPYTVNQQLMLILPPTSKDLVPEAYRNLMTDEKSELIFYYPTTFALEVMDKHFEWMHEPILPNIDDDIILQHII